MILAGFLGSALVVLFPWENVYEIAQNKSWFHMLGALLTLSALGTFLPSPMGFDVILSFSSREDNDVILSRLMLKNLKLS